MPDEDEEYEMVIPESVGVRVFNEMTGANCETMQDTVEYLSQHPEVRLMLARGPNPKQ